MSKSAGLHFGSSDPKPKMAPEKVVTPQKVAVRPEFESFTQLLAQKILERSSIAPETQKMKEKMKYSDIGESKNTQISEEVARSIAQNRRKF